MPSTEEVERLLREVTGKLDVADRKRAREAKDLELKLDQVQRSHQAAAEGYHGDEEGA